MSAAAQSTADNQVAPCRLGSGDKSHPVCPAGEWEAVVAGKENEKREGETRGVSFRQGKNTVDKEEMYSAA